MLSESVATALREDIAAGHYLPGTQLSEVKAAARYDCSRNTLREAFMRLAAEQLVERIAHRGVFIATPTAAFVADLYLARAALEPAGALWGADLDADALVATTTAAVAVVERCGGTPDSGAIATIASYNQRFHRDLVRALGSPSLNREMDNILARMRLTFLLVSPHYPQVHAEHVPINHEIAQLLHAGRRDEAAWRLHHSLQRTNAKIQQVLSTTGV